MLPAIVRMDFDVDVDVDVPSRSVRELYEHVRFSC